MGYTPERSRKGNILVAIGGEGSPLILAAHVDTLGAMVRSIKSNGLCARQPSVDISGVLLTVKTVPYTQETAKYTPVLC